MNKTLFDKIWDAHVVREFDDGSALVYLDRIFLHERTGSVALTSLAESGRKVHNPAQVFATMDHIVDTLPGRGDKTLAPGGEAFIKTMRATATDAGRLGAAWRSSAARQLPLRCSRARASAVSPLSAGRGERCRT